MLAGGFQGAGTGSDDPVNACGTRPPLFVLVLLQAALTTNDTVCQVVRMGRK